MQLLHKLTQHTRPTQIIAWRETPGGWEPVTLQEFQHQLDKVETYLSLQGVQKGDRLALCAPTSFDWEVLQMAAFNLGAIVLGIDSRLPSDHCHNLINSFGAHWIAAELSEKSKTQIQIVNTSLSLAKIEKRNSTIHSRDTDNALLATSTSGTTGQPKILFYSEEQILHAVEAISSALDFTAKTSLSISYLPMAHLFQRVANLTYLSMSIPFVYCSSMESLSSAVREFNPDFLISVPTLLNRLASISDVAEFKHALRAAFGTNLHSIISGTAPLKPQVIKRFKSVGVDIFEAYGLSENIIPMAMNCRAAHRPGTVGRILAPNQVRISSDGEIEVASLGNHLGFSNQKVMRQDSEHFLKTGDRGTFDADGFLTIEGRIGSTIKLENGCKVQPEELEAELLNSALIEQCVVFGHGRPSLVALIYPSGQATAVHSHKFFDELQREVSRIQKYRPSYEKVANIYLLSKPLSVEGGELTPSLKLRRGEIEKVHAKAIEQLYLGVAS